MEVTLKVVILCGGLGTRLSEETQVKPKPMVEIGGRPILWHIMKIYERFGYSDFLLALGYKGEVIKDYFLNYHSMRSDFTVKLKSGVVDYVDPDIEDWAVSLVNTGERSMTGGRLLRLKSRLQDEAFMLTYGDGVSNVDLEKLLAFHRSHGKLATVTAVRPAARFGDLLLDDGSVTRFIEKPQAAEGWINGGFFIFEPGVFDYLENDETILEKAPLEKLASDGQLMAYQHSGYWQSMDTLRDRMALEAQWKSGDVPWKA
jgi:glucose-1-phosphate cytidylyltransferase